ncbi:MAG: aminoacyl-tRNA hydrolase [Draconibacterium sp.]|nr:aminoacyl-tRNA hydrolase [Draconibacterium sp.]
MIFSEEQKKRLQLEINYSATRSSGPGGQNVNKVNTRVELRFSVDNSQFLSAIEKNKIRFKLKNRINIEGELVLVSQVERSQWRNKEVVTNKFFVLIGKALTPIKKRIKTSPTKLSRLKRLESKKRMSQKKQLRKPLEL